MADQTLQTLHTFLQPNETKVSSDVVIKSYSHDHGSGPVLCMVHGKATISTSDASSKCSNTRIRVPGEQLYVRSFTIQHTEILLMSVLGGAM